ncbi:MAG: RimK family alpha-L-glutamate ligase [Lachnospiraceae bacterium]|nr:RimK family alpha-L-glutamate ligase [Lachnospiraceae bacterium]
MNGWLVVNEYLNSSKFNEIHQWLLEAARKQGITMQLRTNAQLLVDIISEKTAEPGKRQADFVLFWDKDVRLAAYLEQLGYPVFNSSRAIGICDDKSLTHLTLMNKGIRMPRTILAPMTFTNIGYTNLSFLEETAERLAFPLVVKECFGSFGQQVYLVNNIEELKEKVKQIGIKPMLFQEYITSSFGRDIRLQVAGSQVIAGMYRYSENGDFRANLTIGGKMKKYSPTKEQCAIALRCCEILGLDFAGVDLLFGNDGEPIVCEVNSNAHFKNIYDCTGVNAADSIMEHIKKQMQLR